MILAVTIWSVLGGLLSGFATWLLTMFLCAYVGGASIAYFKQGEDMTDRGGLVFMVISTIIASIASLAVFLWVGGFLS